MLLWNAPGEPLAIFWELLFGPHAKHSSPELRSLGKRVQPLTRAGWEGNLLMVSLNTTFFFFILLPFLGCFRSWLQMTNGTINHQLSSTSCSRSPLKHLKCSDHCPKKSCLHHLWETFRFKRKKWPKQFNAFGLLFEYLKTFHLESIPLICG